MFSVHTTTQSRRFQILRFEERVSEKRRFRGRLFTEKPNRQATQAEP